VRRARRYGPRALELFFLALLAFSTAQVVWWIYDQNRLAEEDHDRVEALYRTEVELARHRLTEGATWEQVLAEAPHVEPDGERGVRVAAAALAELERERLGRLRRYGWEGGFFLAVLLASMVVLVRALRDEAALARRQQNFAAAVTHELKSPLASLQLSVDTIRLRRPGPERLEELAARMDADLDRLEGMVSKILDTASVESGHRRREREPVELAALARSLATELAPRAALAGVEIAVEAPPGLAALADPSGARTVLRNLLENALRATAAAGGGRVTVRARPEGSGVRLEVEDTGVGFPPEEASKLFLKFYRPGDELRRSGPGTGLGLYLVDRLMRLDDGWAAAESAGAGRGARFTVAWPARPARDPAEEGA